MTQLIAVLEADSNSKPGYLWQGGLLYYKDRLVLPKGSEAIPVLLLEYHSTPMGGHSGFTKTYKRVAGSFFWPGMNKDIMQLVKECAVSAVEVFGFGSNWVVATSSNT